MNSYNRYFLIVLIGFLLTGCSKEREFLSENPDIPNEANANFTVSLAGGPSLSTRNASDKDSEIERIMVLAFDNVVLDQEIGVISSKLIYSRFIPKKWINIGANGIDATFSVSLEYSDTPVTLHLVANLPQSYFNEMNLRDSAEVKVMNDLLSTNYNYATYGTSIPMHTCIELDNVKGEIQKNAIFLRSLAIADVKINSNEVKAPFKLKGMSVWFSPNKGMVAPDAPMTDNNDVERSTLPFEYGLFENGAPRYVIETVSPDQPIAGGPAQKI